MAMTEAAKHEFIDVAPAITGELSGAGIALVVLGILALASIDAALLNSIAAIVAGIALTVEGASLSLRYARMLHARAGEVVSVRESSIGLSAGVIGGAGGVVLGILEILGIASEILVPIALIVFGTGVLFDFGAKARIRSLGTVLGDSSADVARMAVPRASGNIASALVGAAVVTLGILGLAHLQPPILAAAAFVTLGTYLLLDSAAGSGWITDMIS
jgi:hypothetical protein